MGGEDSGLSRCITGLATYSSRFWMTTVVDQWQVLWLASHAGLG